MATVPTLDTWNAGENVTGAKMNANIRDAGNFLLNPPHVSLRHSTTQVTTASAYTALTFDTELLDNDAMWVNTAPTRITVVTPGVYTVKGHAGTATTTATQFIVAIYKNGAALTGNRWYGTHNGLSLAVDVVDRAIAGDYYELRVFANVAATIEALNLGPRLSALWVAK